MSCPLHLEKQTLTKLTRLLLQSMEYYIYYSFYTDALRRQFQQRIALSLYYKETTEFGLEERLCVFERDAS